MAVPSRCCHKAPQMEIRAPLEENEKGGWLMRISDCILASQQSHQWVEEQVPVLADYQCCRKQSSSLVEGSQSAQHINTQWCKISSWVPIIQLQSGTILQEASPWHPWLHRRHTWQHCFRSVDVWPSTYWRHPEWHHSRNTERYWGLSGLKIREDSRICRLANTLSRLNSRPSRSHHCWKNWNEWCRPGNYRSISNLNTISKILEHLFLRWILPQVSSSPNYNSLQSAYRRDHATETALLKMTVDIYTAMDSSQITIMIALDMSAAFNTIDHDVLLQWQQNTFGIEGTARNWIELYLNDCHSYLRNLGEWSRRCYQLSTSVSHRSLGANLLIDFADVCIINRHRQFGQFSRRQMMLLKVNAV